MCPTVVRSNLSAVDLHQQDFFSLIGIRGDQAALSRTSPLRSGGVLAGSNASPTRPFAHALAGLVLDVHDTAGVIVGDAHT